MQLNRLLLVCLKQSEHIVYNTLNWNINKTKVNKLNYFLENLKMFFKFYSLLQLLKVSEYLFSVLFLKFCNCFLINKNKWKFNRLSGKKNICSKFTQARDFFTFTFHQSSQNLYKAYLKSNTSYKPKYLVIKYI